jgi:hypothetical protein
MSPCRNNTIAITFAAFAFLGIPSSLLGQVFLSADGVSDTYTLLRNTLSSGTDNPDCSHTDFGPHITQAADNDLRKPVFVFNIHVMPDTDRCRSVDRQRVEIKTEGNRSTPDYLKGFLNDTVTFRWRFKLPDGFQPSMGFTHIHQIKPFDGDDNLPVITVTARKGNPDTLEIIHVDSNGVTATLATTPLAPLLGTWVEAYEKITYSFQGQYAILINRLDDGQAVFELVSGGLDLWRNATTVIRPKWGIYRSLEHPEQLRDEQVLYDRFCIAKGSDDCASDNP